MEGQLQAVREPREHLLHRGCVQDGDWMLVRENGRGGHPRRPHAEDALLHPVRRHRQRRGLHHPDKLQDTRE